MHILRDLSFFFTNNNGAPHGETIKPKPSDKEEFKWGWYPVASHTKINFPFERDSGKTIRKDLQKFPYFGDRPNGRNIRV